MFLLIACWLEFGPRLAGADDDDDDDDDKPRFSYCHPKYFNYKYGVWHRKNVKPIQIFKSTTTKLPKGICKAVKPKKALPVFDYVAMFIMDGIFEKFNRPQLVDTTAFLSYQGLLGRDLKATLREGRKAVCFFYKAFGIDFRYIPDQILISGNATKFNDSLQFHAVVNNATEDRGRMLLEMNNKKCASFKETIVRSGGWRIRVLKEVKVKGGLEFEGTIPAGTLIQYGDWTTFPGCEGGGLGEQMVNSHIESFGQPSTINSITPSGELFSSFVLKITHPTYGTGIHQALFVANEKTGKVRARHMQTFPGDFNI